MSTVPLNIRGTKKYWNSRRTELNGMARDFGSPTLFLIFGCAKYEYFEIVKLMGTVKVNIAKL